MHSWLANHSRLSLILINFVLMLFVIVFAEVSLSYTSTAIRVGLEERFIRLREPTPGTTYYVTPGELAKKIQGTIEDKEYRVEIDNNGYIYPSIIHDKPDLTIAFLGGSTTQCELVDEKSRFPYLAGRLLETPKIKINSINSSRSGNHVMHSISAYLNKVMANKPSVAILMHNINDLSLLLHYGTYWNDNYSRSLLISHNTRVLSIENIKSTIRGLIPNLYKSVSIATNKLWFNNADEFSNVRHKTRAIDKNEIIKMYAESLEIFISISKAQKVVPVLMTQANRLYDTKPLNSPYAKQLEEAFNMSYEEFTSLYASMNEKVREVGKKHDVMVIDLASEVHSNDEYFYDSVHFNTSGSEYAARIIAANLLPIITNLVDHR